MRDHPWITGLTISLIMTFLIYEARWCIVAFLAGMLTGHVAWGTPHIEGQQEYPPYIEEEH